jgi:hypothetical protein
LFEHFASGADSEAILGDLAERYIAGKSGAWYWKQVLVAIAVRAYSNNSGRLLIGSVTGTISASIANGVFSLWWLRSGPLFANLPLAAFGAVTGFLGMFYLLRGSGYLADKLSGPDSKVAD